MAAVTIYLAYDQLINPPKLSVGIFAQNGVYSYFSAAFVPVIFGIFFKDVRVQTVFAASVTAIVVHFFWCITDCQPGMKFNLYHLDSLHHLLKAPSETPPLLLPHRQL